MGAFECRRRADNALGWQQNTESAHYGGFDMHMIALLMALLAALLIATPVSAQSLCYYWVDADGTITSYQLPPFDIATPNPLVADDGSRLIIAPARRCRDNTVLNAPPPQAAVTPSPMQPPATLGEPLETLPAPAPTPAPDFQPVPETTPDFQLIPLEPAPESLAEPLAEPVPAPELQLEPAPEPGVQPAPESESQPAPESESQPVPTPELRLEPGELSTTSVTRTPPTALQALDDAGG
jgi:hypothetical protein